MYNDINLSATYIRNHWFKSLSKVVEKDQVFNIIRNGRIAARLTKYDGHTFPLDEITVEQACQKMYKTEPLPVTEEENEQMFPDGDF